MCMTSQEQIVHRGGLYHILFLDKKPSNTNDSKKPSVKNEHKGENPFMYWDLLLLKLLNIYMYVLRTQQYARTTYKRIREEKG